MVEKLSLKHQSFSHAETKLLVKHNKKLIHRIQLFVLKSYCDDNNHHAPLSWSLPEFNFLLNIFMSTSPINLKVETKWNVKNIS